MPASELFATLFSARSNSRRNTSIDLAKGAAIEMVGIVLTIGAPYALKVLIDHISSDGFDPRLLFGATAFFALSVGAGTVTNSWRLIYTTRAIDALSGQISIRAIRWFLPKAARDRSHDSGRVLGVLERLPYSLHIVVDGILWQAVPLFVQATIALVILGGLVPLQYLAILLATLCAYLAVTWMGSNRHIVAADRSNATAVAASQAFADVSRNARRVVFNGAVEGELERLGRHIGAKRHSNEEMLTSLARLAGFQYLAVGAGLLLLLALAVGDVLSNRMTIGDFVLLQAYALKLTLPLSGFGFSLSQASVSIANIRDAIMLDEVQRPIDTDQSTAAPKPAHFQVKNLSFCYAGGPPVVLDITTEIVAGAFVVIVGRNGSGKSTFAQLLAGILKPSSGKVQINNVDIGRIRSDEIHRQVLYVPQFIGLFNRSIEDNGLYPPSLLERPALEQLLKDWQFQPAGVPIDLARSVGEQGVRLSGGQVQKLELARLAGVVVPSIILDESTSALDAVSEARVIFDLRARYGHKTTLILITHERRLAEHADEVLFMSAGRLVAQGDHRSLLQQCDEYRRLWETE